MNESRVPNVHPLVLKLGRGASFVATYLLGAVGIPIMAVVFGIAAHTQEAYAWQYETVIRSWPEMTRAEQASVRKALQDGPLTQAAVDHVKKAMRARGQDVIGGGGSQAELPSNRARLIVLARPRAPAAN